MNRLQLSSGIHFRLDAERPTLRGEHVITRRHTSRRCSVHDQPESGVIESPSREKSALGVRQPASQLCREEEVHDAEQSTLLGWSISALIHGLVLTVVAVVNLHVTLSRMTPQKESFRWEVSLMTAPPTEVVVANGVQSQEDFQAAETYSMDTVERMVESSAQSVESLQETAVTQTVFSPDRAHQPLLPQSTSKKLEGSSRATVMSVASPAASVLPPPEIENRLIRNCFRLRRNWKVLSFFSAPRS